MLHPRRFTGRADNGRAAVLSAGTALVMMSAVGVGAAACSGTATYARRPATPLSARTRQPGSAVSVLTGTPDAIAAGVAQDLFASAPVVVLAAPGRAADLAAAAADAVREHAPLLLTSAEPALIHALHPRAVLAVGFAKDALAGQLPRIRVATGLAKLPATKAPAPLDHVVLLVREGDSGAGTVAAVATARAAGARVIGVSGNDPQTDPAAIAALSAARPRQVIAVGTGFGPAGELAARLAVAETGVQLPGGGQVMFPLHRLVALYGHPGTPSLGALGQQGLRASVARARELAAPYRAMSAVPVIPAFEIIATVAEASPGPDGDYSYETPVASLRPWVRRASAAGMYVILDLQAGRASLLAQAKMYQSLLRLPDVGLAIDPEWKLQPRQLPLRQIGSVSVSQVNGVIRWLAGLTARYRLPQKVLVLHQFRLSMISGEQWLDTRYGDLAIVVHMDGQGTPADKEQTWAAVTQAAPVGVFFGWKNFFTKDHPMMSPPQTMARSPQPVMISYQ